MAAFKSRLTIHLPWHYFKGVLIFSQSFPFHSNLKVFAKGLYYFCFRDVIAKNVIINFYSYGVVEVDLFELLSKRKTVE